MLILVSLFFLTLPFPYSGFPNFAEIIAPIFEGIASFWAESVFGLSGKYTIKLISDSTGLYLHLITLSIISLLSLRLSVFARKKNIPVDRFLYGIVLFFLILHLAKYGFDKVFKHQFYFPEPNTQFTPVGHLSKDILYWSAIGSSYSYNVAMGILELIPAVLLLFRRTRLLGGLIAVGVMSHIVVLNFSFDISVKVFSMMLLLASVLIIMPWGKMLFRFFIKGIITSGKAISKMGNSPSRVWNATKIIAIFLILTESLFPYVRASRYNGDSAQKVYLHGAYKVESWVQNGDSLAAVKRIFIHKDRYLIFQYQDDYMRDMRFDWGWGEVEPFFDLGKNGQLEQTWDEASSSLTLSGFLGKDTVLIVGKRIDLERLPIADDSFHWTMDHYFNDTY